MNLFLWYQKKFSKIPLFFGESFYDQNLQFFRKDFLNFETPLPPPNIYLHQISIFIVLCSDIYSVINITLAFTNFANRKVPDYSREI